MRSLALVVCVLLSTACTVPVEGEPVEGDTGTAGAGPLTAATALAALGDPAALDYCTLLDRSSGAVEEASFDRCTVVGTDGVTRGVGPMLSEAPPRTEPGSAAGPLPPGVRVVGRRYAAGCERYVGLADDAWLVVTAHAAAEGGRGCEAADDAVAAVFTAIEDERVRHVVHEPDSFGRLNACELLDRPEVDQIAERTGGGNQPTAVSAHHCEHARVSLRLSVGPPADGPTETVGGREVVVARTGEYCELVVARPLPDRSGLVERMALRASHTGPVGSDVDCENVRTAGAAIVPELPR